MSERPANPTQNSDLLSIAETLAVMERLGRTESYIEGYEDGFRDRYSRPLDVDHARGVKAGVMARWRGAHGGEAS